ncbi:MAG TPA: TetR/AcrR family transcriptional regulator [Flavobacteriaceae bacterium]|nr:TetR/AcrR family transcriptional regulator [Flavobacteriaceae bacterium]
MREKIIKTAAQMYVQLGVRTVTMDDIAKELGISKKTIYLHFRTKNALVREATLSLQESIFEEVEAIHSQNFNPIEELFEIKKFITARLRDEQYSVQYQLEKYYPDTSKLLYKTQINKIIEFLGRNISEGQERGIYREDLDPVFFARIYFATNKSLTDPSLFPPAEYSPTFISDSFLEYHIRGMATERGIKILNELKENQQNEQ